MPMKTGYFEHLCEMAGIDGREGRSYLCLASWLDHVAYEARTPGDMNRAKDGVALRDGYSDAPKGECSVLEMLVALSQEMEYMIGGMILEDSMDIWFRRMIENLGIAMLDDNFWEAQPDDADEIASDAVYRWLDRKYDYDGSGGIFPLRHPDYDQAKAEIWYQMNAYLREIVAENDPSSR